MRAHLVLDLDGTLVGYMGGHFAARPYLHEFLRFCFAHFETVSVWTAATRAWWNMAYGRFMHTHGYNFHAVYTDVDCVIEQNRGLNGASSDPAVVLKPLSKLWDDPSNDMTKKNTLIIDDTPGVAKRNDSNYIRIPEFYSFSENSEDMELLVMIGKLQLILELLHETQDVRAITLDTKSPRIIEDVEDAEDT
jgi:hypothetical protein